MAVREIAPEVLQRLANYRLDEGARATLRELRPIIGPLVAPALASVVADAQKLSHVRDLMHRHGADFCRIEEVQFQTLLMADFDAHYLAVSKSTVDREHALGFEFRARINSGALVMNAVAAELMRAKLFIKRPERLSILSRAILFDLATTYTYHLQLTEEASEKRRKEIDSAIAGFNGTINQVISAIKETSTSLTTMSAAMHRLAETTSQRLISASASSANIAQGVDQTVAATGALADSVRHISGETARELQMARAAAANSEQTEITVHELNDAAGRIGSVVGLISKIAAQTNLLALNAAIEASRAGAAGKGFAVVASEIKALAKQTTTATEDISRNIAAIQQKTGRANEEITSIASSIYELTAAAGSIASAVEEQEAATHSISDNMKSVAGSSANAAQEMRSIEQSAMESLATADEIAKWTARLNDGAGELETKISNFFARVRAA